MIPASDVSPRRSTVRSHRSTQPSEKTESAYIRGAYPFEPAMEFKEIAAKLGLSVAQVQHEFYHGMHKLGFSQKLADLWEELQHERSCRRRISTPYARGMRVAIVDVAPQDLEASA